MSDMLLHAYTPVPGVHAKHPRLVLLPDGDVLVDGQQRAWDLTGLRLLTADALPPTSVGITRIAMSFSDLMQLDTSALKQSLSGRLSSIFVYGRYAQREEIVIGKVGAVLHVMAGDHLPVNPSSQNDAWQLMLQRVADCRSERALDIRQLDMWLDYGFSCAFYEVVLVRPDANFAESHYFFLDAFRPGNFD
jgi:hypothetical protein